MSRQKIFAGNWKMHKTLEESKKFIKELLPLIENTHSLVVLLVPFTAISTVHAAASGSNVFIGAQNIHEGEEGAFTGEVSAKMVKDAGASYVIIGHSERRHYFKESNHLINKKIQSAFKHNLKVILCIGETLDERKEDRTFEVLKEQLEESLQDLSKEDIQHLIIAYEPIWAIGTGVASTGEQAEEVHQFCREWIKEKWGCTCPLLYGGSVKEDNIETYLQKPDIDGCLIGGASLNARSFAHMINCVSF